MSVLSVSEIRELRRRTGAGVVQCKTTLDRVGGDIERAVAELRAMGAVAADERGERPTSEGLIHSYVHHNGTLGVLIEVNCETDFVARTDEFRVLVRYLAEQVAGAAPLAVTRASLPTEIVERRRRGFEDEVRASGKPAHLAVRIVDGKMASYFRSVVLMDQSWVREPDISIAELLRQASAMTGENIQVRRFARFHMGIA
ncbi:MAG: elongation factor Ts [Gemmatimonadaceae bacterium]